MCEICEDLERLAKTEKRLDVLVRYKLQRIEQDPSSHARYTEEEKHLLYGAAVAGQAFLDKAKENEVLYAFFGTIIWSIFNNIPLEELSSNLVSAIDFGIALRKLVDDEYREAVEDIVREINEDNLANIPITDKTRMH